MKYFVAALGLLAFLFVAFMAYGSYLANTPEGKQRSRERDAIENCRNQQADTLQDLAVRRSIRSVCDAMEARFKDKWGRSP